jgi:hypothetical protein
VHPDRGGDGEAFVKLCDAYREVLAELERGDDREDGRPVAAAAGRGEAMPPGPGATRATYVAWLRHFSEESARRRHVPWWRKHPAMARAWLLGLIGLCGVIILCAALALGIRSPGPAARRRPRPESGQGRRIGGAGAARSPSPGRR